MNRNKILSFILSVMLLLVSSFTAFAANEAAEISIGVQTYTVTVTVATAAEGKMTAILKNKDNNKWIDMSQSDEYTASDGKHIYTFQFVMPPMLETGDYVITVGNNVAETAKPFTFFSINEVVAFYNRLNAAASSGNEIYRLLTGEDFVLYYDLTGYRALTDKIRKAVDSEIEAWDLAATSENVTEIDQRFTEQMNRTMAFAQFVDANTELEEWDKAAKTAIENGDIDGKYYGKVQAATVHQYVQNEKVSGIKAEEISICFDGASLLAVADELDFATLNEAFDYYLAKNILDINKSDYEKVKKEKLTDSLFKELKKTDSKTVEELEANADEIMQELLAEPEEGGGSGGSSGGSRPSSGGSGSSGGGNRHPINGDSSFSGDASTDTTPDKEPEYNADFSDLNDAAWAKAAIVGLAEKGIVSGRGDGKFYPNDQMTREEFVKLIIVAFQAFNDAASAPFEDVLKDRWSYPYIASAVTSGLITGLNETTFNPEGIMTREDMAVILYRACKRAGLAAQDTVADFTDADEIAEYAKEAVGRLAGQKIINGMGDGTFLPKGTVTRAQAAKAVYELLALMEV